MYLVNNCPIFNLSIKNKIFFCKFFKLLKTGSFNSRKIEAAYPNPDFIPMIKNQNPNDILVFKLKRPFDLSPTVQPGKLPAQGFLPQGTNYHE